MADNRLPNPEDFPVPPGARFEELFVGPLIDAARSLFRVDPESREERLARLREEREHVIETIAEIDVALSTSIPPGSPSRRAWGAYFVWQGSRLVRRADMVRKARNIGAEINNLELDLGLRRTEFPEIEFIPVE